MEKNLIVAMAANGAIGKDNALLWHISEDLKFFKATTMGCPVIMGRRTFESIGRPLPGRLNIVVSRTLAAEEAASGSAKVPAGVAVAPGLAQAWEMAEQSGAQKAFLLGGGQLYAAGIGEVERMFITEVMTEIDGADTFFPTVDKVQWRQAWASETKTDPETGYEYRFVEYVR